MTTTETLPHADLSSAESQLHIHMPAEALVRSLGSMAASEAQQLRRTLSEQAQSVHEAALTHTLETERAADIPSAVLWPGIVGQETVATMALARRQANRGLRQHPTDPTRHLIVPL